MPGGSRSTGSLRSNPPSHRHNGPDRLYESEWPGPLEAEFDRLDKDKSGDLDAKDLTQSKLRVSHFVGVGK